MKRICKSLLAILLVLIMFFQAGEYGIAYAAAELDRAVDPASYMEFPIPERFLDGGKWFFIPEAGYVTGEKSTEKLYIPIQRSGGLEGEAEIILKIIDLSAKHDVNYTAEIYKERITPETVLGDFSILDIALNAEGQEEIEFSSENELGEAIYDNGGAELVDGEGNTVANVTATRLDENGNPIPEERSALPGDVEEGEWTEAPETTASPTDILRSARDTFTGTVSDRQELSGSSLPGSTMSEAEYNQKMADTVEEQYPGKEYRLQFAAGEDTKLLVITPKYSEAADGDAQILLMLKDPSEGYGIGEEVNPVYVTILDEDEPEPVTVSMADEEVMAENGKAVITVTRTGRLKALKGVYVSSWDSTAEAGKEYSGIGAKLAFPMGITSRTIELPVYHGTETKDFYVTITALEDEQILTATTHVIIPPAQDADADSVSLFDAKAGTERVGRLMSADAGSVRLFNAKAGTKRVGRLMSADADSVSLFDAKAGAERVGRPMSADAGSVRLFDAKAGAARVGRPISKDPVNLRYGAFDGGTDYGWDSDTELHFATRVNKEETAHYWLLPNMLQGCAYDGIYLEYSGYLNWCDAEFRLVRWTGDQPTRAHVNYFDDGGVKNDCWLYMAWNGVEPPWHITIENADVDTEGPLWVDSYSKMWVKGAYLIKRQFIVDVESPEVKSLLGMSDAEVLTKYQRYLLDHDTNSSRTLWTEDSFSINAIDANSPIRLVGVEVKKPDGTWYRISTIDGKSSTATVEMTADFINELQKLGCISWSKNGKLNGDSYKGRITVRPVFDYVNVDVEIVDGEYGSLLTNGTTPLQPGKYTYHLGDKLVFSTQVNSSGEENRMNPDGVSYYLRKNGNTGVTENWIDAHYLNGTIAFQLTGVTAGGAVVDRPYYLFKPTFTQENNTVTVIVSDEEYERFDTTRGIFAPENHVSVAHEDGRYTILIDADVLTNDIYELQAYPKSGNDFACWRLSDGKLYAENVMYIRTEPQPSKNVITLLTKSSGIWTVISGTVASSTFNVSSGRSASDIIPANGAYILYGDVATWSDAEGRFTLPAACSAMDSYVRFLVTYNGVTGIQEVKVSGARAAMVPAATVDGNLVQALPVNAGLVTLDSYSTNGARILSVIASQTGQIQGALNALTMNGKNLTFTVQVSTDNKYVLNNEVRNENIKEVRLFFMSQYTGEIHGVFSSLDVPTPSSGINWSWDEETGEFVLVISKFSPDKPELWTYGDVLMIELVTDKLVGFSAWSSAQDQKWTYEWDEEAQDYVPKAVPMEDRDKVRDICYEPVSSGFGVYADPDYEPTTFQLDLDDVAEILGVTPQTDEEGNLLDETRASFGNFPFIGEITAGVHVFSRIFNSATLSKEAMMLRRDLEEMAGDEYADEAGMSGQGGATKSVLVSAFFTTKYTAYGGVRFMLGVIVAYGGGQGYQKQQNPFRNYNDFQAMYLHNQAMAALSKAVAKQNMIVDDKTRDMSLSDYGGPYFKITVFFGFYLDYGYMEITRQKDGVDKVEISHEMLFMGAGGFIGFSGAVGYTWPFMLVIPAYINLEAGINLTFFFGASANPTKTLDDFQKTNELQAQDFGFNFEFSGRLYATGTIGAGFYKVAGIRCSVTLAFESGYGSQVTSWKPDRFTSGWGYVTEVTFTGSIDLVFTSLDLYSATWPLPLADGFLYFYQEARRANLCVSCVYGGLNTGRGTPEDRSKARQMANELAAIIDEDKADIETLKTKTSALREFAYKTGIITWTTYNRIAMNKQGGIVGSIMEGNLTDESDLGVGFHTNPHVNSAWVAQDGELSAAYSVVKSSKLVEDAFAQPSAKLLSIGNNKFLMVFLDDSPERDEMMAATLKWTIYDAGSDTWTAPQTVQPDSTGDSRPNLVDAGDKVILSWASAAEEKYDALRYAVAKEKGIYEINPDTQIYRITNDVMVAKALEDDPARVMSILDIFTVEFDKASQTFGPITQLTDDSFYDDCPIAVYDAGTKDYIVMYYKTAQDTEAYSSAAESLMDLVSAGPDPDKTYSVIAYMLYNGTKEEDDAHEVGWVKDYYYPNETSASPEEQQETLAQFGGQRFLPSSIKTESGDNLDPPVSDLTAIGFNGFAAYAYTVDLDFDLNTAADRELYLRYYDFKTHRSFASVRVAGSVTEQSERYDKATSSFVPTTVTRQVDVGAPKLIRNGGSTFLFWREDGETLKYLNLTEMFNAKVAAVPNPDKDNPEDWTWGLKSNGTFAVDAATGEQYAPRALKVDFSSALTDSDIHITDYEVMCDRDDNLYVVWTDAVTYYETDPETGETYPTAAQEIYATAMVRQADRTYTYSEEGCDYTGGSGNLDGRKDDGDQVSAYTARWSKPYRLTRDNGFNDGLALALDDEGGLIIIHNQYFKKLAQSEAEMMSLVRQGKIGITADKNGNLYAAALSYNTPVSLMVTRCDQIGSLEATAFEFSDEYPVAGEPIIVTAAIENVGLTNAEGCEVKFYEFKNGVQGRQIWKTIDSSEIIEVNSAKQCTFLWTVPADGPEGYCIQAVIAEKRKDGTYYDAVESYSAAFETEPELVLNVDSVAQEGDSFRVSYTVENVGNAPAKAGTKVGIRLVGLYGDLNSKQYGFIENSEIYSRDIAADLPLRAMDTEAGSMGRVIFADSPLVEIPASLFRFCGYDAIQLVICDDNGIVILESDQYFVRMENPVNLALNGGKDLALYADDSADVALTYDTTLFIDQGTVVYSVEDQEIAYVDGGGRITALNPGSTKVTATLLPYGMSASVDLTVYENSEPEIPVVPSDTPAPEPENSVTITPEEAEALESETFSAELEGGTVILDRKTLLAAAEGGRVTVTVTKNLDGSTTFNMSAGGEPVDALLQIQLPEVEGGQVLMLVKEDGSEEVIKKSMVEDGVAYAIIPAGAAVRVADNAKDFPDVSKTAWYAAAVDFVSSHGLFQGTDKGFEPDAPMNRAMMVTVLYRLEGAEAVGENLFEDMPENTWYTDAVIWAGAADIVKGTDKGFEPDALITREQVATMLYRYAQYIGMDTRNRTSLDRFTDGGSTSDWAKDAMEWAVSAGLFQGDDLNALNPGGNATRAQVAALLQRMIRLIVK